MGKKHRKPNPRWGPFQGQCPVCGKRITSFRVNNNSWRAWSISSGGKSYPIAGLQEIACFPCQCTFTENDEMKQRVM